MKNIGSFLSKHGSLIAFLMLMPVCLYAQNNLGQDPLGQVQQQVTTSAQQIINIVKIFAGIICLIGLVVLLWKLANNNRELTYSLVTTIGCFLVYAILEFFF